MVRTISAKMINASNAVAKSCPNNPKNRSISVDDNVECSQEQAPSTITGRFTVTPANSVATTDTDSGYSGTGEPFTMDQSTQVNFPILMGSTIEQWKKSMRGQPVFDEVTVPTRRALHSSWAQLRPVLQRPRSLNMSTETYQRSKLSYQSEVTIPMSRVPSYPSSELTMGSQHSLRDKSPPLSITSATFANMSKSPMGSIKSPSSTGYLQPPQRLLMESSNSSVKSSCKCICKEQQQERENRLNNSSTPEGLSWRRLHMSRAKLKATATTSELLSGFAMVAMVELQINEPTNVPEWLFVMFAVCTTILVAVHIFALMISTYILPNIDAISKLDVSELVAESPHERMRGFIELAWAFSTILGLFLFLVEVAILCWVKFWDYSFSAAIAATVIVIPVLIVFVMFAMHFYHSLVVHKCDTSVNDMEKLENLKKQLDEVSTSPV